MPSVVDGAVNGGQVERGSSSHKQMGAIDGCCSSLPTEYVIAHYTVCRNRKMCTACIWLLVTVPFKVAAYNRTKGHKTVCFFGCRPYQCAHKQYLHVHYLKVVELVP